MKIAYLTNSRFPSRRAHSSQIAHMCQAFSDLDNEVCLFVNKNSEVHISKINEIVGFNIQFSVRRLFSFKLIPFINPTFHLSEFSFVVSFILNNSYRSFDFYYVRSEWLAWALSLFVDAKKIVWESHEAKFNLPARRLIRKCVKIIVISEGIQMEYIQKGVEESRMLVAHDGIDESFFDEVFSKRQAREYLGLPRDEKIVMYIGGFDKWKGIETFFKASVPISDFLFVVIGGNSEEIKVQGEKYPKIKFLGFKPYKELRNFQQAADILVVPNTGKNKLSANYTSPLKLFAHMTSGIPLLVSKIPSLGAVVNDRQVTFFEPDSYKDLISQVEYIFLNYESKIMTAKKLKKYSSKYTWKNRAKSIYEFVSVL